jgi:hypothetical protein
MKTFGRFRTKGVSIKKSCRFRALNPLGNSFTIPHVFPFSRSSAGNRDFPNHFPPLSPSPPTQDLRQAVCKTADAVESDCDIKELSRRASRGESLAVLALAHSVDAGDRGAWVKLKYLKTKPFVDAVAKGEPPAAFALRVLKEIGNKEARFSVKDLPLAGLADRAGQGDAMAVFALRSLVEAGTRKARFVLKNLEWGCLSRKAEDGDFCALYALMTLVWAGNLRAGEKIAEIRLNDGRAFRKASPELAACAKKAATGDPRAAYSIFFLGAKRRRE